MSGATAPAPGGSRPDRRRRGLLRRRKPRSLLHRYLGRGERVVLETRQHPFAIVSAFLDALALIVPLLAVVWGIAGIAALRNPVGDWLTVAAFAVMAAAIGRLFWRILQWEFARVVVSTEKLVHVHGILNRRIASTPLVKVSELTVSQPLLGRILGYGSLVVDTPGGGEAPLHGLAYIPDPAGVYRVITDTARAERAWEGGAVGSHDGQAGRAERTGAGGTSDARKQNERPDQTMVVRRDKPPT